MYRWSQRAQLRQLAGLRRRPAATNRPHCSDTPLRHPAPTRVLSALEYATATGSELSISAPARTARVHRSFIHHHRDLHDAIATARQPPPAAPTTVSNASLRTELTNVKAQNQRLLRHLTNLEKRLSELMGEQVYRTSGIGAPDADDDLRQHVHHFSQRLTDLRQQLEERTEELTAARAANRES
jgi:hypothetical protein